MSNVKRVAAITLATALSVPLALAAASPATAADPFDTASASLFAAAYKTQRVAQAGFHVAQRISFPDSPGVGSRLDAWTNLSGEAAVRSKSITPSETSIFTHQGSYLKGTANGPTLEAWTKVNANTALDRKIVNRLPNGANTRFSVGRPPADTQSMAGFGFTAGQVYRSFDSLGYMPWNAADVISACGTNESDIVVTCTGEVTTDGNKKVWTFDVDQRFIYDGTEWFVPIKMLVKTDSDGYITSATYDVEQGTVVYTVTSEAEYAYRTNVPVPNLKKSNTVNSHDLTRTAARAAADWMAKDYIREVNKYLEARGLPLTPKTAKEAGAKVVPDNLGWPNSQWVNSTGYSKQHGVYAFEADGTDDITWSTRTATVYVKHGKWVVEKSAMPPFPGQSSETAVTSTARTAAEPSPMISPLWQQYVHSPR